MIKVVIAEDDFRVAQIHEQFLSKINGVKIVGKALNGKDTLTLLKENEVDLLLLDIYMPDMLGVDLIKEVHSEFPTIDIIMITASSDKHMVETSIRNGVIDYIIKPVTFERFRAAFEHYKHKRNLFEANEEVDQNVIDEYVGVGVSQNLEKANTPKGIDPLTFEKVKEILVDQDQHGITADEMGEKMGASRTTARRYLEYLISIGEGKAELSYGIVGRPERKYFLM